MSTIPAAPAGSNTVNPFLMTIDATSLIDFLVHVLEGAEVPEDRTLDHRRPHLALRATIVAPRSSARAGVDSTSST